MQASDPDLPLRPDSAAVVLGCVELQPTIDFFVERVGLRLERISPADDPRTALLTGAGLRVLLRRGADAPPVRLRLRCADGAEGELVAPNGTRIELVGEPDLVLPAGGRELVVSRASDAAGWVTGRAGMSYRDLIPGRAGGRFIASLIHIADGGPVADQVHFHAIRLQLIVCLAGWVRVVYEDQGPPFVLEPGDVVLQPPYIRHRVLESSPGLEVLELACPAEHDTFFDHELALPTDALRPERAYGDQRFARHVARDAPRTEEPGWSVRATDVARATSGLADVRFLRATTAATDSRAWRHAGELLFAYVLAGELTADGLAPAPLVLGAGDALIVPPGDTCTLTPASTELELLQVRLPG